MQIANTQEKNVPKDKACTNAYRAMQGQSVSKRVMKPDRALKTKDENASYYPTSLSIEIKHVHNDRWGWQRPKKSELSGWQLPTRKNFPGGVRKSFSRQKKTHKLFLR